MSAGNGKYEPRPGRIPGVAFNLGGHDFVLAPLGLGPLREYDERHKLLREKDPPAEVEEYFELNVEAIVRSLQRNYPEITREAINDLLDSVNVPEAMTALLHQSGVKRLTPGELPPRS